MKRKTERNEGIAYTFCVFRRVPGHAHQSTKRSPPSKKKEECGKPRGGTRRSRSAPQLVVYKTTKGKEEMSKEPENTQAYVKKKSEHKKNRDGKQQQQQQRNENK
jgi:hypothetical protein